MFCSFMRAWLVLLVATVAAAKETTTNHGEALTEWLRTTKGGFFHPSLTIRPYSPGSPFYSMHATKPIPAKEPIIVVPREILVTSGGSWENCDTAKNLIHQLELGNDSKYAPYINYLLDQPKGQLPSSWSDEGKQLLTRVLGGTLPPDDPFWFSYANDCHAPNSGEFEENAYMMLLQRGWDHTLIPVFDMMSHRNGKYLNTESDSVHDMSINTIEVRASRDIAAGEELYTTYNLCEDCANRHQTYGTPEILRDYGFVEQYPQRWIFHQYEYLAFELTKEDDDDEEPQVNWFFKDKAVGLEALAYLKQEERRLKTMKETELADYDKAVPKHEWDVIVQYQEAISNAMALAAKSMDLSFIYDMLKEEPDPVEYRDHTCRMGRMMDFPEHEHIETIQTPYQRMEFYRHPKTKDMAFMLDLIWQQFDQYRPHYHEMMVHYTARYLNSVKRVLFVGGGDSMLLHEVLKYPTLELVVGLELDQKVTRAAFKYFGSQPHFNNEKVQWWYGDAAKSLLMLPKDYFGSFDLVLVDLSETVMSMTVTEGLDIFGALALLLAPNGIIIKNEHYVESLSDIFDYTFEFNFEDCPVLCNQLMALASYDIDFFLRTPKDHNIETLMLPELTEDVHDLWHSYRKNHTGAQKNCIGHDPFGKEAVEQLRSPGILMIIDVQDASALPEPSKLKGALKTAVEKEGFTVISAVVPASGDSDGRVVMIMFLAEGYVVARTWPKHKYCAFDIHLWSKFDKHDSIKHALTKAIGSPGGKSSYSYRIVAGGMFGIETWKQDEKNRGPRATRACRPVEPSRDAIAEQSAVDTVLKESMSLIPEDNAVVVVVCGNKSETCASLKLLSSSNNVQEVVPLSACPGISDVGNEKAIAAMEACEKAVFETLQKAVSEKGMKIRAIVLDPSARKEMGVIVNDVVHDRKYRRELLAKDMLFVATLTDENDLWKRALAERFRRIRIEPVFRAEVLFNSTDSSMEMAVTSSGDQRFMERLVDLTAAVEKQTKLVTDVRHIQGGRLKYEEEFEPSQIFTGADYDPASALDQWLSQRPLGHQTVSQFEVMLPQELKLGDAVMANYKDEGRWYEAKIDKLFPDGTFGVLYDDGDVERHVRRHLIRSMEPSSQKLNDEKLYLVPSQVKGALKHTLSSMKMYGMNPESIHEFEAADGLVLASLWQGGCVIVLWDGRIHVDINLFTYAESTELPEEFTNHFKSKITNLERLLLDEQPRGFGGVVNFLQDDLDKDPYWVDVSSSDKKASSGIGEEL